MSNEPLSSSSLFAVVVNDNATQLTMLSGLVRKAGLEPRAFSTADAALADMTSRSGTADMNPGALPALIVTDLYMPGIDGWRFCRLLRSPEYASLNPIPILVVSATYSGDEATRIAADLGAEAFLPSPVDVKQFVELVQKILVGQQTRNPLRVLIVDDNASLSAILQVVFTTHGYHADTALTARDAAEAFNITAYDVAVLDYHLPDGKGDALLDVFRAQQPDCVCLMMTSDPEPNLAVDWMKRGAAAYLHKPFQSDYLIELCVRARRERALLRVQDLLEMRTRELRESEERFTLAINGTGAGLWDWDLMNDQVMYSAQWKKMLEYDVHEVEDAFSGWKNLWHPDDCERIEKSIEDHLTGKTDHFEIIHRLRCKNGDWRWILTRGDIVKDAQGKPCRWVGTNLDITERKRAEEALREKVEELHHALDHIKTLRGIVPICANCKKIRDDKGFWNQVEVYVRDHTEAQFTHGICPECKKKLYAKFLHDDKGTPQSKDDSR